VAIEECRLRRIDLRSRIRQQSPVARCDRQSTNRQSVRIDNLQSAIGTASAETSCDRAKKVLSAADFYRAAKPHSHQIVGEIPNDGLGTGLA
jgi:hypothetical protein